MSGKILRGMLKSIINKSEYKIPSTIEDVTVIDEIKLNYSMKILFKLFKIFGRFII
jgi:hypothetical protein